MSREVTDAMVRAAADAYLAEVFLPEDVGEKQDKLALKLASKVLEAADRARKPDTRRVASGEERGCPCLYVEPCSYACSCANSIMSGGCTRCARYGSEEQRLAAATRIAAALSAAPTRAQAASAGEPVAWETFEGEHGCYEYRGYANNETYRDDYIKRNGPKYADWVRPLYAAPTDGRSPNDGGYSI